MDNDTFLLKLKKKLTMITVKWWAVDDFCEKGVAENWSQGLWILCGEVEYLGVCTCLIFTSSLCFPVDHIPMLL